MFIDTLSVSPARANQFPCDRDADWESEIFVGAGKLTLKAYISRGWNRSDLVLCFQYIKFESLYRNKLFLNFKRLKVLLVLFRNFNGFE